MFTTSPTGRACGRRVRGGVYAENRLSEDGLPIEYFIVDPPTPVELDELGLAPVGVQLIEVGGGQGWQTAQRRDVSLLAGFAGGAAVHPPESAG